MKHFFILLLFLGIGTSATGQRMQQERIKALRTGFFTEKLNLTQAEAEKFWPIYNAYDDELSALKKEERTEIFQVFRRGLDDLSDNEANALIDKMTDIRTREFNLHKQLIEDLRKVPSPKKIIMLRRAEEEFKRTLLERFRQHKGQKN